MDDELQRVVNRLALVEFRVDAIIEQLKATNMYRKSLDAEIIARLAQLHDKYPDGAW